MIDVKEYLLYINQDSKNTLQAAVSHDAQFLKEVNIMDMDYSLLVGLDKTRHELVCGIIDYICAYNAKKKMEWLVKALLMKCSCTNQEPTVLNPPTYMRRSDGFYEEMEMQLRHMNGNVFVQSMMSSLTSSKYAEAKTCVFWDIEDCPIPDGLDPEMVAKNIKSALAKRGYLGELTIWVYGDKYQIQDYYQSAGIELHCEGSKYERFRMMHTEFYRWLMSHDAHQVTNMMVISGDNSEFASCLQRCKETDQNILMAQPEDAPRRCCGCSVSEAVVTDEWIWDSLAAGGDPITITRAL
ncbi:unnamed protein product [Microthlaspi erraticum]|uniref:PIPK domain-containing protein n=1 Tax=Microthlaspi erraticum TaxID=1685480 RepID=A0A6D2IXD6_9BRAS|nr:unnamed protein product [Microthlaspi erraticum]